MSLTARQVIAMHLYYSEGWSVTKISRTLSCSRQAVHSLLTRAKWTIATTYSPGDVDLAIHMREILRPSAVVSSTRDVAKAAWRQEQLLDALEQRMLQRAAELASIEQCMSGGSFLPTKPSRNKFDQWEVRYLNTHKVIIDPVSDSDLPAGWHMEPRRNPRIPDDAYKSGNAAWYCAADENACGLECVGCRRERNE